MWWNDQVKAVVKRKEYAGRRCWELEMKIQEKCVWKSTKRKREKLKGT